MKDSEGTHYVGMPKGFFVDPERSDFDEVYEIDPFTLGQYTGLTDKNGAKIFEGDVVDVDTFELPLRVKYNPGIFILWRDSAIKYKKGLFVDLASIDSSRILIIGNRWDNPELLTSNETS